MTTVPGNQAVQTLVGTGVLFSNVQTFSTSPNSIATFTGGLASGLGFDNGVFLSTSNINAVATFNAFPGVFISNTSGAPGDPDLNTISSPTFDAAVLQFDFVPTGDTLKFRYIFASEEYNEFVNTGFNDVFAFFLTGPNPNGPAYSNTNIALIPSTVTPVAINNVNNGNAGGCASGPCNNCAYYVDNLCINSQCVFDGYTVVLTALAIVEPCSTYTIKLAIADVGDSGFDSGVFLEAGSFSSNIITVASATSFTNGYPGLVDTLLWEDCSSASLIFVRHGDLSGYDTIALTISGTATMTVDYPFINDTLVFLPGMDTIIITIMAYDDGYGDAGETIIITINDTICNNPTTSTITLVIDEVPPLTATVPPDSAFCAGTTLLFDVIPSGGAGVYTTTWMPPSGPNFADSTSFAPTMTGYYVASVYEYCNDTTLYDSVFVEVFPVPNINLEDELACIQQTIQLGPGSALPGFNYLWTPPTYLDQNDIYNPIMTPPSGGTYTYTLTVDSAGMACYSETMTVTVSGLGVFNLTPADTILCDGDVLQLNAGPGYTSYTWSTSASTQSINVTSSGAYSVLVVDANNCNYTDTSFVTFYPAPSLLLSDVELCSGGTVVIGPGPLQPGLNYTWNPSTNLDNPNISNPTFSDTLPDGSPSQTYTYVLVVDSAGFSCSSDSLEITLNSNPIVDFGMDTTTVCENSYVVLNAGVGASYVWNTGASTQAITTDTAGTYVVVIATSEGCINGDSIYVEQLYLPVFDLGTFMICEGDSVMLGVNPLTADSYEWITGETTPSIWVDMGGQFWLQATNSCGTSMDTAHVLSKPNLSTVVLPNVLTPNGDGQNDEYVVAELIEAEWFRLDIYNRWGRKMFTTTDWGYNWKGEADGGTVTAGTYYVVLTYENCYGEEYQKKGTITVFP